MFQLSYTEAMLTQFAWFIAYGVVSLPAAAVLMRLALFARDHCALGAMLAGCLIVPLATHADFIRVLWRCLSSLRALRCCRWRQSARPRSARPEALVPADFSQAFNSLGTVIGPYLGATIMLSGGVFAADAAADHAATRAESLRSIDLSFLLVAGFSRF